MSFPLFRHVRPHVGTTLLVGAAVAALALHAPPERAVASCDAPLAAPRSVVDRAPGAAPHIRTASGGEVTRAGSCDDATFPPLALLAAAVAMLAVPRARQGTPMEL